MNDTPASPAWFRTHFNEDYLLIYSGRSQEQADREVESVIQRLKIRPGEAVLDLCCGFGRHLVSLARHGIAAIGVDLSPDLLEVARRNIDSDLVCADMRHLPFRGGAAGFHVVVNFFTSFGYFDAAEDNILAAREMARVLRPGGRFVMDLMNPVPTIRDLVPRTDRENGPFRIREERSYCPERHRIEKTITLTDTRSGDARRYFESVRVYREPEIRGLLDAAGLEVVEILGDFDGGRRTDDSPRMIVFGERSPS